MAKKADQAALQDVVIDFFIKVAGGESPIQAAREALAKLAGEEKPEPEPAEEK